MIKIIVDQDHNQTRLDRFVTKKLNISHGNLCKLIRERKVYVNNEKIKDHGMLLESGQEIIIKANIDTRNDSEEKESKHITKKIVNQIKQRIKYEDENIVIIDKPAGLATQSGGSLKYSLDDIAREIWPDQARIVHRLDKDTSGLIVMAKNRTTANTIFDAFKDGKVQKEYLAVLHPIPNQESGIISTNISKAKTQGKMHKCQNDENGEGKNAVTEYKVIKTDKERNIALVKFMPKTGRTHQIRLHSSWLGCPIVGDFKYTGNCKLSRDLHLLAYSIKIPNVTPEKQILGEIPDFFILKI